MNKTGFLKISFLAVILILGAVVILLFFDNVIVNNGLKKIHRNKEDEFQKEVTAIKNEARKDITARYGFSDKYFEDIAEKLKVDRQRLYELQEKVKNKVK